MYKKIRIENFRGISWLELENPRQFNLLVGENNSCKTSILESIFLLTGPSNPHLPVIVNGLRGFYLTNDYSWSLIFHKLDSRSPLELYGEIAAPKEKRSVTIKPLKETAVPSGLTQPIERISGLSVRYSIKRGGEKKTREYFSEIKKNGGDFQIKMPEDYEESFNGVYVGANYNYGDNVRRFNDIRIKKQQGKIIKVLQKIEPELQDLSVGSDGVLYCDVGFKELIPVNMAGEGINRLLSIVLAIYDGANGVVLVDEIENGFHYSKLGALWETVFQAATEFNAQVFATTHSFENLKAYSAAYENFSEEQDNMRLFRIESRGAGHMLTDIDPAVLKTSLDNQLEVR